MAGIGLNPSGCCCGGEVSPPYAFKVYFAASCGGYLYNDGTTLTSGDYSETAMVVNGYYTFTIPASKIPGTFHLTTTSAHYGHQPVDMTFTLDNMMGSGTFTAYFPTLPGYSCICGLLPAVLNYTDSYYGSCQLTIDSTNPSSPRWLGSFTGQFPGWLHYSDGWVCDPGPINISVDYITYDTLGRHCRVKADYGTPPNCASPATEIFDNPTSFETAPFHVVFEKNVDTANDNNYSYGSYSGPVTITITE